MCVCVCNVRGIMCVVKCVCNVNWGQKNKSDMCVFVQMMSLGAGRKKRNVYVSVFFCLPPITKKKRKVYVCMLLGAMVLLR